MAELLRFSVIRHWPVKLLVGGYVLTDLIALFIADPYTGHWYPLKVQVWWSIAIAQILLVGLWTGFSNWRWWQRLALAVLVLVVLTLQMSQVYDPGLLSANYSSPHPKLIGFSSVAVPPFLYWTVIATAASCVRMAGIRIHNIRDGCLGIHTRARFSLIELFVVMTLVGLSCLGVRILVNEIAQVPSAGARFRNAIGESAAFLPFMLPAALLTAWSTLGKSVAWRIPIAMFLVVSLAVLSRLLLHGNDNLRLLVADCLAICALVMFSLLVVRNTGFRLGREQKVS